MGKIFDTVTSCLTKEEIKFQVNETDDVIDLGFNSDSGPIKIKIIIEEEKEWFLVIGFTPSRVPLKYVEKILPTLNIMNRNSIFNYWTLDPEDGELSYKCGATVDQGAINEQIVKVIVYGVASGIDSKYEEIMREIYK